MKNYILTSVWLLVAAFLQNFSKRFLHFLSTLQRPVYQTHVLVYLGLELDSIIMVVRIPKKKLQEVVEKINSVIGMKKVSLLLVH